MRIVIDQNIKNTLIKRYWKETRKALSISRQSIADKVEYVDPDRLKTYVKDLLNPAPIKSLILDIWGNVGGKYANDTIKRITLKSGVPVIEYKDQQSDIWKERMRIYSAERSLKKVEAIMSTQEELINNVIDNVIDQVNSEGLGIVQARNLLKEQLSGDAMTELENYQAERIARTEVNGASNTGSFEAAKESGLDMQKIWIHSGNLGKGYRQEHVDFATMEPQEMDYQYAENLEFPGDENADPGQIINCRCTIGYNVD
jgi:hypothetical protein